MLGEGHFAEGNHDAAIRAFEKALSTQADLPKARYNLGLALDSRGPTDAARAAFEEALRLRPRSPEVEYALANLLARRGDTAGLSSTTLRRFVNGRSMSRPGTTSRTLMPRRGVSPKQPLSWTKPYGSTRRMWKRTTIWRGYSRCKAKPRSAQPCPASGEDQARSCGGAVQPCAFAAGDRRDGGGIQRISSVDRD